jgi:hypothetical protein
MTIPATVFLLAEQPSLTFIQYYLNNVVSCKFALPNRTDKPNLSTKIEVF